MGRNMKIKGMTREEAQPYIDYLENKYYGKISYAEFTTDGDCVEVKYKFEPCKIERIRRITGYLVGGTDGWVKSKREEEKNRVKHGGLK